MRTTQFIGLTSKCREQVKDLKEISSRGWSTSGMFDEEIPLGVFYRSDGSLAAVEYVIASPWSSGPMIFTGLLTPEGPSPYNWKEDPSVEGEEYNSEKGLYWV